MRPRSFLLVCLFLIPFSLSAKESSDPEALELIKACRARLYSQSGRALLTITRKTKGKTSIFQGALLGKMEKNYSAIKLFLKKPILFKGVGVVYIEDRDKKTKEIFSFLPGQKSITKLNKAGIQQLLGGTGVDNNVVSGVSEIHKITGTRSCFEGNCIVLRSGRSDGKGAYFETLIRKDIAVPVYAERRSGDGTLLWTYEVTKLEKVDGIWTERSALFSEPQSKTVTSFTVDEIDWGIEFSGNFFLPNAFVDTGWKK